MTFCKLRKALGSSHKEDCYELSRFCSKINIICVGSFQKLLNYFIKNFKFNSIITYADRRFFNENNIIYSTMFEYIGYTKPNYFYIKNNKRIHRFNYSKQNLISKFNVDSSKTEFQITDELGIKRIWDCGHLKFKLIN